MRSSTYTLLAAAASSLCTALPTDLKDFLLVTTSQANASPNPANLQAVSATSLFVRPIPIRPPRYPTNTLKDPFNQPALLLRMQPPGYASLPTFTLTSGTLSSIIPAPFNGGVKQYNSTIVEQGQELRFLASVQPEGNVGLSEGYLVTVDGETEGWTVCRGVLGSEVLRWRGGVGCGVVYVHAVRGAPY